MTEAGLQWQCFELIKSQVNISQNDLLEDISVSTFRHDEDSSNI